MRRFESLSEPEVLRTTLTTLASAGAQGQLVIVADPLEETFPFEGHVELLDSDSSARLRLGEARSLGPTYLDRLAAHRAAIRDAGRAHGWGVLLHRTDQSAAPALLSLSMALAMPARAHGS